MIVYLDASALVKRYVAEAGSPDVEALAWEHGLRGCDSVHLASALAWSEALGETVAVATYDRELWRGAQASGLSVWPKATP